jgi:hypothetical protein
MSLLGFQLALRDLIASPDLCLGLRASPEGVLARYDLSGREQRRLVNVVRQRGMSVNCTLYRVNRVTPIYTLLTMTCHLLGNDLRREMDAFWASSEATTLQFKHEIHQFAVFIRRRLREGILVNPYIEEVLDFEQAVNVVQYLHRQEISERLAECESSVSDSTDLRLHPLVRLIPFRHDPERLLPALADLEPSPVDMPQGEYYLLVDARLDEIDVGVLPLELGRSLHQVVSEHRPLQRPVYEVAKSSGLTISAESHDRLSYDRLIELHRAKTSPLQRPWIQRDTTFVLNPRILEGDGLPSAEPSGVVKRRLAL